MFTTFEEYMKNTISGFFLANANVPKIAMESIAISNESGE